MAAGGGAWILAAKPCWCWLTCVTRDTYARLAAGFDIGLATVYRYIRKALDLLAAQAPDLERVVREAARLWYLILDGTLVRIDRLADDRPYHSGKHKPHGERARSRRSRGRLLWASPALPGSTHELTAARRHGVIDALVDADLWAYADLPYQDAGPHITVPLRRRPRRPSRNQRAVNRNRARNRAPAERAVATLKTRKLLAKLPCCPQRASTIIAAIRVLQAIEEQPP